MDLIERLAQRARERKMRIALPEATDERTLRAARMAADKGVASPLLVGDEKEIRAAAAKFGIPIHDLAIVDTTYHPSREAFYDEHLKLRRKENLTLEQVRDLFKHTGYFAMMMARFGQADAVTMGAVFTTADVLRAAIKIGGVAPGVKTVSGSVLMRLEPRFGDGGVMLFADPAVVIEPDVEQLADIAIATADTAIDIFQMEPRIAMLSFSTKGSARHPQQQKVVDATEMVRKRRPELQIEGELQADAAMDQAIGRSKAGECAICGRPNILIFPEIGSANIGHKLLRICCGADVFGPILQGLAIPCSDMSRGANANDVYVNILITALKARRSARSAGSQQTR